MWRVNELVVTDVDAHVAEAVEDHEEQLDEAQPESSQDDLADLSRADLVRLIGALRSQLALASTTSRSESTEVRGVRAAPVRLAQIWPKGSARISEPNGRRMGAGRDSSG